MTAPGPDKQALILDATLAVLARDGISGVSMRAVAREADIALGLASYHFTDKHGLVAAALERIADADAAIVEPEAGLSPVDDLHRALRLITAGEYLALDYLSLRLQLWSLAGVDDRYAAINQAAQRRYLDGLARLIAAARPDLDEDEVDRRAADVLVIQNGVWLTSALVPDPDAIDRAVGRCEAIALAD